MSGSKALEAGSTTGRYAGIEGSGWQVYQTGIKSAMSDPSLDVQGVWAREVKDILWAIIAPAAVTGFKVNLFRLVGVVVKRPDPTGDGDNVRVVVNPAWITDRDTVPASGTSCTASTTAYQHGHNDRVALTITDITVGPGGIGDGFTILWKKAVR